MITRTIPRLPRATTTPARTRTTTTPLTTRRLASTRHNRFNRSSGAPTRLTPSRQGGSSSNGGGSDPDAAIHAATKQTIRRIVLTGAVALITVVGAITGARLKADRDVVKQREAVRELSLDERIAMLEKRRAELVGMKMPLERKLIGLRERMEAEQRQAAEGKA